MSGQNTLLVNLHQLGKLTGRGFRKIKELLVDLEPEQKTGREFLYDAYKAVPLLFESRNGGNLDLSNERAKLANAQTEKTIIETEKLKEKYVLLEDLQREWETAVLNARAKLLLLPKKMSSDLKGLTDTAVIEERLEEYIYNALTDLSQGR